MKRKQKKHSARKKTRKILRSSRRVQLKKQNTIENPEKLWEVANNHLLSDNPLGALPYLSKLVDFDPNDGILLFNYGACLAQTGDFQAATIPLEKAREIGTRIGQLPHLLGTCYFNVGQYDKSISIYKGAIESTPADTELVNRLWWLLDQFQRHDEAIEFFSRMNSQSGRSPLIVQYLGEAFKKVGREEDADIIFSEILKMDSDNKHALEYLAGRKIVNGEPFQAIDLYRRASILSEPFDSIQSAYLMSLNYADTASQQDIISTHNSWGDTITNGSTSVYNRAHDFNSGRPLRIGYVSSDFGYHAVGNFITPILKAHNRKKFNLTGYYNYDSPDPKTEKIKSLFDEWRDIHQLNSEEVCNLIVRDKIDILIDLNGHTALNSLEIFSMKPAPLQVSWLGYPNTTGLKQIDFIVGDEIVDPSELGTNYIGRSKPLRLTHGYHCYHQDAEIEVADLPAEKNGFITFGSFNALTKLSNKTIELWSSVLNAVPHSKLLLKRSPLNEEPVRRKLLSRFQDAGVEVDRIALEWEMNSTADHLAKYKNVDIALDSYPYSGTTTTCDALWMGVPVVSLCGENRSSRVSASILYQIGKSEWVADSEASFVRISKDICKSIEGLKDARRSLRNKIIKSSLYQENIVSKNLEEVLQSEWQRLCREKNNLPG